MFPRWIFKNWGSIKLLNKKNKGSFYYERRPMKNELYSLYFKGDHDENESQKTTKRDMRPP